MHPENQDEPETDEFGLTTADYERAGLFVPKRTSQAQLSWTRADGKHASVIVYDHELGPLLDALEAQRRQERKAEWNRAVKQRHPETAQSRRTIRNRLTNLWDKYL